MTASTVTTADSAGYREAAAELRRIADAIDSLRSEKTPFITLSILPEHTVDAVDAVALAVLGKEGKTERVGSDWRRRADSRYDRAVYVSVHATVPGPPDERDAELERLRAEVEALRSATAADAIGLGYSRADDQADDPTPVSPARVPLHTGAMTENGLVEIPQPGGGCE